MPPDSPIDFLENVSETFVDYLLHGSNVIVIGDLNCNRIGSDPDGHALSNFARLMVYHISSKPQQD